MRLRRAAPRPTASTWAGCSWAATWWASWSSATLAAPLLVGLFWGAPLVAAEAEAGTTQFAWMQSVTRKRWLGVKIGWMLLAAAIWGGVISALVTWWASPTNAEELNQFDPGRFDITGIVPVGYSLFALALGVAAGALLRRTLPALAVTLAGFIAVRVVIALLAALALHERGHRELQRAQRLHPEGRLLEDRVGHPRPERPAASRSRTTRPTSTASRRPISPVPVRG